MRNHVENDERKVMIERVKLIEKMQENRTKHADTFTVAMDTYHNVLRKALAEMGGNATALSLSKTLPEREELSKLTNIVERHHKPVCYLTAYDEVIEMFQWDTNEHVTLTVGEFRKFVLDKWDWNDHFVATNRAYTTSLRN